MTSPFAALALDPARTGKCILTNPYTRETITDADGNEAFVLLRSVSSPEAEAHRMAMQERARRLGQDFDPAQVRDNYNTLLARLTVDWNLIGLDGQKIDVPCSFAVAKQLYAELGLRWIKDQVGEFLSREGNFQTPGLTRSAPGPDTSSPSA